MTENVGRKEKKRGWHRKTLFKSEEEVTSRKKEKRKEEMRLMAGKCNSY